MELQKYSTVHVVRRYAPELSQQVRLPEHGVLGENVSRNYNNY